MIKFLFSLFKRIIMAFLLIYAYNKLALPVNLYLPFNYITIGLITVFGIPAIFMLMLFSLICI